MANAITASREMNFCELDELPKLTTFNSIVHALTPSEGQEVFAKTHLAKH